jgi:succinoglycan biosynthesis transport protein ExoP
MATLPHASSHPPAEGKFDIHYYAHLLWRGRWIVLTSGVVGFALGLFIAFLQTPQYRASAMLQIEPPTPTFMTVTDALVGGGNYWQNADFYNTQFQVLRSKGLGERVVDRLKLKDRPPFQGHPDPGSEFMSHVGITPVTESRLVMVDVTLPSAAEAALWANTLADVYVEETLSGRVEAARRAYEWLQDRLSATQKNMREAQDKLFRSYQSQDLFVPEGGTSTLASTMSKLNEDYQTTNSRRILLEAALKQVAQMRAGGQGLDTVPQVATDSLALSLQQQLASLNVELSRLKEKYKEAHPEVQKILSQIAQVTRAKAERGRQIVSAMQAEFAQLQRRESELQAAIDAEKAQAASQSRKGAELEALRKEADSAKNLYEVLLQKLNETDIAASIRSNNVSVVERAAPPSSPVRPNKPRIAVAALLLGLVLGAGLVLGKDYLDNTLKDPEEMERYLHLDLLAAVPRYDETSVHLVTEAYQNLRTALIFARKEDTGQIVLVTGTAPQEGKTTTLVNLAKLVASSGEKALVMDCDLRRAQLHHRLDLTREPGLTDWFVKHEDLDRLIRPTHIPNLYALTAGPLPPNPPALLARKTVLDLLAHLRAHFEWIFVDSPPLASVTDALLLARHADTVLFVIQHNKVDKKLIKRSVSALRRATPNLLGGVLNAVDVRAKSYQYYYYSQEDDAKDAKDKPRGPKPPAKPRPVAVAKRQ